ncbi:MAG: RIP metalloprotease RseP [Chitinophagales bacterium]
MIKAVQLILSLSFLVVLHELGHFLAARAFKTRVEKFYMFFDFMFPFPHLLNFALFKKKIGDTEYGIGWFPMGGYVKIAGMVDESTDLDQLSAEPKPDEFRSKKNWQKLIIMLGGIIMNLIVGWLIYSHLLFWVGEQILPTENARLGVQCDSLALKIGFRNGDIILSHDGGKKFESLQSVGKELLLDDVKTVTVNREGSLTDITIPADFTSMAVNQSKAGKRPLFEFNVPCMVGEIAEKSAIKGIMQPGDVIINIDSQPIRYFSDARPVLQARKSKDVPVAFLRKSDTLHAMVHVMDSGVLGFFFPSDVKMLKGYVDFTEKHFGFFESLTAGAAKAYGRTIDYIKQFKLIFSPKVKGYKQLGGVGTMAGLFPDRWDWIAFWSMTAFLSLILAVANLLPIPMLDGGYVILLLFEMISGRKLSDATVEKINRVGLVLLLGLMIYANGNDLWRLVLSKFF